MRNFFRGYWLHLWAARRFQKVLWDEGIAAASLCPLKLWQQKLMSSLTNDVVRKSADEKRFTPVWRWTKVIGQRGRTNFVEPLVTLWQMSDCLRGHSEAWNYGGSYINEVGCGAHQTIIFFFCAVNANCKHLQILRKGQLLKNLIVCSGDEECIPVFCWEFEGRRTLAYSVHLCLERPRTFLNCGHIYITCV